MLMKGFKFGMLLQLTVGPVCLFIFQSALAQGFYTAETGVLGVFLVDGLYILAALLGIASIIDKRNVQSVLKIFSSLVLFIFGTNMILSQLDVHIWPVLSFEENFNSNSVFFRTFFLTVSNPLTILFWAGVLGSKIAEDNLQRKELYIFGLGALFSTLVFLTLVALIGSFAKLIVNQLLIQILNLFVGILLILFSLKLFIKNKKLD